MSALRASHRRAASGLGASQGVASPAGRPKLKLPHIGRQMATTGLLVVLVVALLAAVPGLRGVLREFRDIAPAWIVAAVGLELASAISFVVVFRLFFDRLSARDARALAWAQQGSGALLPTGGAGGVAIGGWLIHLTGAPLPWIVRRSAGLFFLGALASCAALVGAGVALIAGAPGPHVDAWVVVPTAVVATGTVSVALLPVALRSRKGAPRWLRALGDGVREAEQITFNRHPSWRLLGAVGYLGFDIAVLWVALRALGHPPSVPVVVLAYSVGYAANSLPVPGGIGVLDAGLTGALVLYGTSPVYAAAAVLVYHAIAFWIPGVGGLVAYLRLRPRLVRSDPPSAEPLPLTLKLPERKHTMNALAVILKPINHGWAVTLTNGRELVRFRGLWAKRRALRYLAGHSVAREASDVC